MGYRRIIFRVSDRQWSLPSIQIEGWLCVKGFIRGLYLFGQSHLQQLDVDFQRWEYGSRLDQWERKKLIFLSQFMWEDCWSHWWGQYNSHCGDVVLRPSPMIGRDGSRLFSRTISPKNVRFYSVFAVVEIILTSHFGTIPEGGFIPRGNHTIFPISSLNR
jgi:hypothetical protein